MIFDREAMTPTVNLNGTSAEELLNQQTIAIEKLNEAIDAVRKASPHVRDWQTRSDSIDFYVTQKLYAEEIRLLNVMVSQHEDIALRISRQIDDLERFKVNQHS